MRFPNFLSKSKWPGEKIVVAGRSHEFVELSLQILIEVKPDNVQLVFHDVKEPRETVDAISHYSGARKKVVVVWRDWHKATKKDKLPEGCGYIITADHLYDSGRTKWFKDDKPQYIDCQPFTDKDTLLMADLLEIPENPSNYMSWKPADWIKYYQYYSILEEPNENPSALIRPNYSLAERILAYWHIEPEATNAYSLCMRAERELNKFMECAVLVQETPRINNKDIASAMELPPFIVADYRQKAKVGAVEIARKLVLLDKLTNSSFGGTLESAKCSIAAILK